MNYYSTTGERYSVKIAGVGKQGTHYCVTISDVDNRESTLISIESTTDKILLEKQLAEYATKNGLIHEFLWKLRKGDRKLQGRPIDANEFITVDEGIKANSFTKYLAAKTKIAELEAQKKQEIEEVKKDFAERVETQEAIMQSIEDIVTTGTMKQECKASWERDIDNGIMLLIRTDTFKVIQWKYMTPQELQMRITDPGANPENNKPIDLPEESKEEVISESEVKEMMEDGVDSESKNECDGECDDNTRCGDCDKNPANEE